uniref:EF-hand domain-containing protein n=1 Tax=Eutreptiella gymnastica TaxID=73025 RepID=A0A7S1NIH4_9EUGL|mmetsp:Transcript_40801/g.73046  ORF Transcript_40801/g.73046 Transcript_40801/m.73046 type:complete len:317 (+) Transcript_40801:112-1062(+)
MYIDLARKKNGRKVKLTKEEIAERVKEQELAMLVADHRPFSPACPYTFFYPATPVERLAALDPSKTPQFAERCEFRKRKVEFFKDQQPVYGKFKAPQSNLQLVHRAFLGNVSDDGTLDRKQYFKSLVAIGVGDTQLMERTFDLFDSRKDGIIDYQEVITAIDVILNGKNKNYTATDCFKLCDPTGCGYIIMNYLQELKTRRAEQQVSHMMVKALLEIFERLQAEDEANFMKTWAKKSKGKGKKGKGAGVEATPPARSKKIHLNYDEFCEFLAQDPILVQAFLVRILITMETVYRKNKQAVDLAAADADKPAEEAVA